MLTSASTHSPNEYCRRERGHGLMGKPNELPPASLLWRAVLGQAIRDVYRNDNARREVIIWLKSKDFDEVCDYAEVEPMQMKEQIAALCRLPLPLAKKYGKKLRDHVMQGIHQPEQRPD